MNFMNRKMFQKGGASNTLGPYQIRDLKTIDPETGQPIIYDIKPDFINQMGFNPYKILYDKDLEKGSEVQKILQQFKEKDAPGIGPFQAREDIGTNIADIGFRLARQLEPMVRGGIRGVGEITGIQSLKDAGGELFYGRIPEGEGRFGQPFGFQMGESVIPSDADRARFMLRGITEKNEPIESTEPVVPDVSTASVVDNKFINEDIASKVSARDFALQQQEEMIKTYSPEDQKFLRDNINPNTGFLTITPEEVMMRPERTEPLSTEDPFNTTLNLSDLTESLESLSEERQDLENRFAEEDIQRPADIDVDEITNLLNDIQQPSINLDKTEADSLLETIDKFDGLSSDELKFEIDKTKFPGMTELDKNKAEVAAQVKEIKEKEEARIAAGEDPDPDKAPRSPVAKKLNEPGFFGSDRFLNFIRNVGAGLTETGQIGSGLGVGAAKAAEERAARDIAKDEREYEMEKLIAIEEKKAELKGLEPMKGSDIEKGVQFEDDLMTALRNFDEDERIVSDINQILNEDINDPTAFGARGLFGIVNDKLRNAIGMGETEWANLPAEVRTKKILEITAQRSVRSILGESGKTISNLDRQIVAQIFGNVDIWTSPAELRKILSNSRANIIEGMRAGQSTIISRAQGLKELGYPSEVVNVNDSLIARILGFSFDNIEQYKRGDNVSGFEEVDL